MKHTDFLFALLCAFVLQASAVFAAQSDRLAEIERRKQDLLVEYDRGKLLLDYGSRLMIDAQRSFTDLVREEIQIKAEAEKNNKGAR